MISNIVAFIIIFIAPLVSFIVIRQLKRKRSSKNRILAYQLNMGIMWTLTGIVLFISNDVFLYKGIQVSMIALPYAVIYIILIVFLPFLLMKNKIFRDNLQIAYTEKKHIYPSSHSERIWYTLVAITVGICEEILYRSFFFNYLHTFWDFSIIFSVIIGSMLFGIIHYHQGIGGMLSATINGLIFSYLFLANGSLLLPIIFHILFDMKIVAVSKMIEVNHQCTS